MSVIRIQIFRILESSERGCVFRSNNCETTIYEFRGPRLVLHHFISKESMATEMYNYYPAEDMAADFFSKPLQVLVFKMLRGKVVGTTLMNVAVQNKSKNCYWLIYDIFPGVFYLSPWNKFFCLEHVRVN